MRVNFARYSIIPICNLEMDANLYMIDILYSRSLQLNRHVLWYSDNQNPDLGGHEERDFRIYFQDEIENPELCVKGLYRNYTIEIELSSLAVNTILQADYLKEFEDASILAA